MIYVLMVFGLTQHNTYEWRVVQEYPTENQCMIANYVAAKDSASRGIGYPYHIAFKCELKKEGA